MTLTMGPSRNPSSSNNDAFAPMFTADQLRALHAQFQQQQQRQPAPAPGGAAPSSGPAPPASGQQSSLGTSSSNNSGGNKANQPYLVMTQLPLNQAQPFLMAQQQQFQQHQQQQQQQQQQQLPQPDWMQLLQPTPLASMLQHHQQQLQQQQQQNTNNNSNNMDFMIQQLMRNVESAQQQQQQQQQQAGRTNTFNPSQLFTLGSTVEPVLNRPGTTGSVHMSSLMCNDSIMGNGAASCGATAGGLPGGDTLGDMDLFKGIWDMDEEDDDNNNTNTSGSTNKKFPPSLQHSVSNISSATSIKSENESSNNIINVGTVKRKWMEEGGEDAPDPIMSMENLFTGPSTTAVPSTTKSGGDSSNNNNSSNDTNSSNNGFMQFAQQQQLLQQDQHRQENQQQQFQQQKQQLQQQLRFQQQKQQQQQQSKSPNIMGMSFLNHQHYQQQQPKQDNSMSMDQDETTDDWAPTPLSQLTRPPSATGSQQSSQQQPRSVAKDASPMSTSSSVQGPAVPANELPKQQSPQHPQHSLAGAPIPGMSLQQFQLHQQYQQQLQQQIQQQQQAQIQAALQASKPPAQDPGKVPFPDHKYAFLLPSTLMPPSVLASVLPDQKVNSKAASQDGPNSSGTTGGRYKKKKGRKSTRMESPQDSLVRILSLQGYGSVPRVPAEDAQYETVPSPLQLASFGTELVQAIHTSNCDKLSRLLETGLSPNPCNKFRDSIVDLVCKRANAAIFQCLVEHGCDLRVCDGFGRTPLHHCCWASEFSPEIAETILRVDWQQLFIEDKRGQTPLEYVRPEQASEWIEFLEDNRDRFFPTGGAIPPLQAVRETRPDNTLPDPPNALPVELAGAISSGQLSPEELASMDPQLRARFH